jgi:hypothetical protein
MDLDIYLLEQFFGEPMPCDKQNTLFLGSYYLRETMTSKLMTAMYAYRSKFYPVLKYVGDSPFKKITLDTEVVLGENVVLVKKEKPEEEAMGIYDPNNIQPIGGVPRPKGPNIDIDINTMILTNGTDQFVPIEVLVIEEFAAIIEGTLNGEPAIAKIGYNLGRKNTKNYASYTVHDDFKMVGKNYTVIIMEKLQPVTREDNAFQLALDILVEIRALHRAGKYHYDIKPDNIMRRKDGKFVLIDFDSISETVEERNPQGRIVPYTGEIKEGHTYYPQSRRSFTPSFTSVSAVITEHAQYVGGVAGFSSPVFDLIELGYSLNWLTGNENGRSKSKNETIDAYLLFVCSLPLSPFPLSDDVYDRCLSFFL